jgi:ElaB/YqjD/DUF883 family membrane-anchored ribosome-binding protein
MNIEKNKYETPIQQKVGEPGSASATAQNILDRGTEVYVKAEQAVSDVYDKTAQTVSKTYEQAKSYSNENPGKTILIALGIGVGLGFLLGASSSSRRSRTSRFAQPVVNALSDLAQEYFR